MIPGPTKERDRTVANVICRPGGGGGFERLGHWDSGEGKRVAVFGRVKKE